MIALPSLSPQRLGRIRSLLLAWYEEQGEYFPWRDARNPYWALVAGVCAQQTQMSRVLPLWRRWTTAYPTLIDTANAERDEILRTWGNAGYPRRALYLHEASRHCVSEYGGRIPVEGKLLLALPGVGPFTAAIVRSFGYGMDTAAIDTNVVRVIGRLLYGDLQPARETPPAKIEKAAIRLLQPGNSTRWNPALMDYGARICRPQPRCGECIIASFCAARPRFEAGEHAEPMRTQTQFEGSDRQWRGLILFELRSSDAPLRITMLLSALAANTEERTTVSRLLRELETEGLAWQHKDLCGLGSRTHANVANSARLPAASQSGGCDG
jgi:A/G-specific adenine glycosylase